MSGKDFYLIKGDIKSYYLNFYNWIRFYNYVCESIDPNIFNDEIYNLDVLGCTLMVVLGFILCIFSILYKDKIMVKYNIDSFSFDDINKGKIICW